MYEKSNTIERRLATPFSPAQPRLRNQLTSQLRSVGSKPDHYNESIYLPVISGENGFNESIPDVLLKLS